MYSFRRLYLFLLWPCSALVFSQPVYANDILTSARAGDVAALSAALEQAAPVDAAALARPLFFAAQRGHAGAVAVLLDHGADPETVLDFGGALQKAARGDHIEVVGLLLAAGADPNLPAGENDITALHEAAERGAMRAARELVARGADVNARDRHGLPPIHLAARKGRAEMLAFLSDAGAAPVTPGAISAADLDAADVETGRVAAIDCNRCHEVEEGVPPIGSLDAGPSLVGVVGRPKASVADYPYSEAMQALDGIWTPEELNRFIADPPGLVPGLAMEYVPELSREERVALIAYLGRGLQ